MRAPEKIIMLLNHCNLDVSNQNDYIISSNIIRRVVMGEDLSMERISAESNISQASISRFIRKAGFDDWKDFRESCSGSCREMLQMRKLFSSKRDNVGEIADDVYERIISNITATKKCLDSSGIEYIIDLIEQSKEVFFVGDEHALSDFFTLQLDVVFSGTPAYLYRNSDIQQSFANRLSKDSLIIFMFVDNNFILPEQVELIKRAKEKGSTVVIFSQQDCLPEIECDYFYKYGKSNSVNDGYYSLFFLSQVMSELLVSRGLS
ncbi:MAG: hypothetical protein IKW81_08755 [Pseudobutyrivibrio sp.]|nr:hypothetical protein [Pseudobutyrivibrio sp.]